MAKAHNDVHASYLPSFKYRVALCASLRPKTGVTEHVTKFSKVIVMWNTAHFTFMNMECKYNRRPGLNAMWIEWPHIFSKYAYLLFNIYFHWLSYLIDNWKIVSFVLCRFRRKRNKYYEYWILPFRLDNI